MHNLVAGGGGALGSVDCAPIGAIEFLKHFHSTFFSRVHKAGSSGSPLPLLTLEIKKLGMRGGGSHLFWLPDGSKIKNPAVQQTQMRV